MTHHDEDDQDGAYEDPWEEVSSLTPPIDDLEHWPDPIPPDAWVEVRSGVVAEYASLRPPPMDDMDIPILEPVEAESGQATAEEDEEKARRRRWLEHRRRRRKVA